MAERNDYYPFGGRWDDGSGHGGTIAAGNNRYALSGKERQTMSRMGSYLAAHESLLDFGARFYGPATAIFLQQDPLAEKYYNLSPYAYCANNPVNFVDPDGRDPIYTKRFFGQIKLIGDDGKCGSGSYLVKGAIARKVRKASKSNQFYEGDLSENDSVVHIPTGQSLEVVKQSYEDTEASQKENGGHSYAGKDKCCTMG